MYVDLHIGRIRMDIDNLQVTWDLDKTCKASNVSMLDWNLMTRRSSLHRSSLLHRPDPKSIPGTGVRLQSNNDFVDAGLISVPF
jgi:hypothetical protein